MNLKILSLVSILIATPAFSFFTGMNSPFVKILNELKQNKSLL